MKEININFNIIKRLTIKNDYEEEEEEDEDEEKTKNEINNFFKFLFSIIKNDLV